VEGAKADDGEVVKITTAKEKSRTVVAPAKRCPAKILMVVVICTNGKEKRLWRRSIGR
jgi:hypothetical protein